MNIQNFDANVNQIPSPSIEQTNPAPKKSFLSRLLKWLVVIIILIIVLPIVYITLMNQIFKNSVAELYGGKENLNQYLETVKTYDEGYAGDYQSCLTLEPKQKQFCLWLASEKTKDNKICDLMSPTLYPVDDLYSQEKCYLDVAYNKNDRTICNRVTDKNSCVARFTLIDAQRKICEPLFNSGTIPSGNDCFNYAVAQKTKASCDGLIAAGGQSWKERCDINANVTSTSSLSIKPTESNKCVMTKISKVENSSSGSTVEFLNGIKLYATTMRDPIDHSEFSKMARIGDVTRLCIQGKSTCRVSKFGGTSYDINNMTSGFSWFSSDSLEACATN